MPTEPDNTLRWSGQKLAQWLGVNGSSLRAILGPLEISTKEGYDFMAAVPAVLNHFRAIAEKTSKETAASTARQKEAEAGSAELDFAVKLGKLVSRDEMRRLLEQLIVSYRESVRAISWLTLEQKKTICDLVAKMVLPSPGEEGE